MANNIPSYQEQLESMEWKSRRDTILNRDGNKCSFCAKGPSERVIFDDVTLYVGIDYSKSEVDCSKAILSASISFSDYVKVGNITKMKQGTLPNSNIIGFLSKDGDYLYSIWKKNDDFSSVDLKTTNVAKVQCNDGLFVDVVYIDEKDLEGLKLPRVYVLRNPLLMQVHHKRYIINKYAWEYDDCDLVTLCQDCHSKVHSFLPVQTYAFVNGKLNVMNYTPCRRCNGTGYLPEFNYVKNGICFRCRGARFEELIENNNLQEVNLLE